MSVSTNRLAYLVLAVFAAAITLGATSAPPARSAPLTDEESKRLLSVLSDPAKTRFKDLPGMTPEATERVLAFLKNGKPFSSIEEFRRVSALTDPQFEKLAELARLMAARARDEKLERLPGEEKPATAPDPAPHAGGPRSKLSAGAKEEKPPAASGLNLDVKPNYYSVLPGYDLSTLPEETRRVFLDTINREMCTCGCSNDTLASCLVNDPGCPIVKARVKKLYSDLTAHTPAPPKP
jgi:hypothetical protein